MESRNLFSEDFTPWWTRSIVASVEKLQAGSGRDLFLVWKAEVKSKLQGTGLWFVVDPDQDENSHELSASILFPYIPLRKQARDYIQSAVAFQMECTSDPRECWIYLQKAFAPNNAVMRYQYLRRLWNLRMQEGEKVLDFHRRVRHVLDHLIDMGQVLEQKVLILLLIDALPQKWPPVAVAYYRCEAQIGGSIQTTEDLFKAMETQ